MSSKYDTLRNSFSDFPLQVHTVQFTLIQTLAVACGLYFVGLLLRRGIPVLDRLNIPAAVIGGLMLAGANLIFHDRWINFKFDTAMQPMLMVLFFTTIGMSAGMDLLKKGGVQVLIFLLMGTAFCFVQNGVGIAIARMFGADPLLGVIAGSVTLVGGPATGLAFAPLFERAGVIGAGTIAIASATFGIVCGGLVGGPIATFLIHRFKLSQGRRNAPIADAVPDDAEEHETVAIQYKKEDSSLFLNIIVAAVAMGLGSIVSSLIESFGWTLPSYIGAMLVASLFRNLDSRNRLRIDPRLMELLGTISLNVFLVVALMDLKLWELVHLAGPLAAILAVQVALVAFFAATVCFWVMGKDYESAVISGGFIGFVLGTTANAVANMNTVVAKFGAAPRAFLIVPLVGAFFIDFTNALVITMYLNWLQ